MKPSNISVLLIITALTIGVWALANRPIMEPLWPDTIQGFSFSPMKSHHDPMLSQYPTIEEIDSDLALLAGKTHEPAVAPGRTRAGFTHCMCEWKLGASCGAARHDQGQHGI